MSLTAQPLNKLLLLVCFVTVSLADYHGFTGVKEPHSIYSIKSFSSELNITAGCHQASTILSDPDWETSCAYSEDVSDCYDPNYDETNYEYCNVFMLCNGWVPNVDDYYPKLEGLFSSSITTVSRVEIFEKGSRGWLDEVNLLAADGTKTLVFKTSLPHDAPSEDYKKSPKQQPGEPFFAPGLDYRGGINKTVWGTDCMNWKEQYNIELSAYTGLGDHNFCRNPTNDEWGPWCYTASGGLMKEYCNIPESLGCDDSALSISFNPPLSLSFTGIEISMRRTYGAVAAIDAVKVDGNTTMGCFDDDTNGHWLPPHCNTCKYPYKGANCVDQSCSGNPCYFGTCSGTTCICAAGYYGSDCNTQCPGAATDTNGLIIPSSICSGQGTCSDGNAGTGLCTCQSNSSGAACSVPCPRNSQTDLVCSGFGTCFDGASGNGTCACAGARYGADCSLELCGNFECHHGTCTDGKCTCAFNSADGYWSGGTCNECHEKYTGVSCTYRNTNKKWFAGELTNAQAQELFQPNTNNNMYMDPYMMGPSGGGDVTPMFEFAIKINSVFYLTVEGTGNYRLGINQGQSSTMTKGCLLDINENTPTGSCTIPYADTNPEQHVPIYFEMNGPPDDSTVHTYNISVNYEASCPNACEPHGYCYDYDPPEAFFDPYMYDPMMYGKKESVQSRKARSMNKRHVLAAPTANIDPNTIQIGYHSIQFDINYDLPGFVSYALTDDLASPLSVYGYLYAGDIFWHWICCYPQVDTRTEQLNGGPATRTISFWGLQDATSYNLFNETIDDFESTPSSLSVPWTFATRGPPTATILGIKQFSTFVDVGFQLEYEGPIIFCLLPTGTPMTDFGAQCINGSNIVAWDSIPDGSPRGLTLQGLSPLTSYDLYYVTATDDFDPISAYTFYTTFVTYNVPELDIAWNYVSSSEVHFLFTSNISGGVWAVLLASVSPSEPPTNIVVAVPGGNILQVGSQTSVAVGTQYSISFTGLTLGSNYKVCYATKSTSLVLSPEFPCASFTAPGVAPTFTSFVDNIKGSSVRLNVNMNAGGYLFVVVRLLSQATLDVDGHKTSTAASPYLFYTQQLVAVDLSPPTLVEVKVTGLTPDTDYALSFITSDGAASAFSASTTVHNVSTNFIGVTQCNMHTPPQEDTTTCTLNAVPDTYDPSFCVCSAGFICSAGECVDEAAYYEAQSRKGRCSCDQNSVMGHWNGTTCSVCYPGYFGADCKYTCKRGALNAAQTACDCETHFEGTQCDKCPPINGYYGVNCSEQSAIVPMKYFEDLPLRMTFQEGLFQVLSYSLVTVIVEVDSSNTLADLSSVEIVLYQDYEELAPPMNNIGPSGGGGCGDANMGPADPNMGPGDPNTDPMDSNMETANVKKTIRCDSRFVWDKTAITSTCEEPVPEGFNYAAVIITAGDRKVSLELQMRAVTGCCNGHGFCGNFTDTCKCGKNSEVGFWDDQTQCATCMPGYTGRMCNEVAGRKAEWTSGEMEVSIGDERWFGFLVERNMPIEVTMNGTGDCDLYATATSRCGEGWTYNEGYCYKVFAGKDDCTEWRNVTAACAEIDAEFASIRNTEDFEFYRRLIMYSGIASPRKSSTMCSNKVFINMKRSVPPCIMRNSSRPKTLEECHQFNDTCEWWYPGCNPKPDCDGYWTEADCHVDPGTGADNHCMWIHWNGDGGGGERERCVPSFEMLNSNINFTNLRTMLQDNDYGWFGTYPCEPTFGPPLNQAQCLVSDHCRWDAGFGPPPGACFAKNEWDQMHDWNRVQDFEMQQWDEFTNCGALLAEIAADETTLPQIRIIEAPCKIGQSNQMNLGSGQIDRREFPVGGYVCMKKLSAVESNVSNTSVMSPIPAQRKILGVPDCTVFDPSGYAQCNFFSNENDDYALMRMACLDASNVTINVSYVRMRRVDSFDPNSDNCTNDETNGFFAGEICTECAPRYSGRDCERFRECTVTECGSHGTCATSGAPGVIGYCTCAANYYGENCDSFCDGTTCGGGNNCNAEFEVCNRNYGSAAACDLNLLCNCSGNMHGATCDECDPGYYGVGNCAVACPCNGQPCNYSTGVCNCLSDEIGGYWNSSSNCSTCQNDYFGRDCTTFCQNHTTCSQHGYCQEDGSCLCDADYYTATCSVQCTESMCTGHGSCDSSSGTCNCMEGFVKGFWGGSTCARCRDGYWGTICTEECDCSAHGSCSKTTGECNCYSDSVNGFWVGTNCRECAEGYTGSNCNTVAGAAANEMGIAAKIKVGASFRRSKSTEWGGAALPFASGGTNYFLVSAGAQISLFKEATDIYEFVSSCNIDIILGRGDVIIGGAIHNDYALFILTERTRMYLVPVSIVDIPLNSSGCFYSSSEIVRLQDPTLQSDINTTSASDWSHQATAMALDPTQHSLYVTYNRYNSINSVFMMSRIYVQTRRDFRFGFYHALKATLDLSDFFNVSSMAYVYHAAYPALFVSGLDRGESVQVAKIFLPNAEQDTIRNAFSFLPDACNYIACQEVVKSGYFRSNLFLAIRTVSTSLDVSLVRIDVIGEQLKNITGNYKTVTVAANVNGAGFMVYDDYIDAIYIAVGNATPSVVYKFSALDLTQFHSHLPLSYEQSLAHKQIAVAAHVNSTTRRIVIVNKLDRVNLVVAVLYDVHHITPTVVHGSGGTIVNVTGSGFSNLGKVLCKFGTTLNRQAKATYVSSTMVQCQAPRKVSFDACEDVPLEISVDGSSFTNNKVLIRHLNEPTVTMIKPSSRGALNYTAPLIIVGSGFLPTAYLLCNIDGLNVPATFLKTTEIECFQPLRTAPSRTVIEVSLDGQKFSSSGVPYFIVGPPMYMTTQWIGQTDAVYNEPSAARTNLTVLQVDFLDGAGTPVKERDELLRGHNVTLSFINVVVAPKDKSGVLGYGKLRGTLSKPIVEGAVFFYDLHMLFPGLGTYDVSVTTTYSSNITAVAKFAITVEPHQLQFTTLPSHFSTGRRKLDVQPKVALMDISHNIVRNLQETVTIYANVIPMPGNASLDCLTAYSALPTATQDVTNETEYNSTCSKIAEASVTLENGEAEFQTLRFTGPVGAWYYMNFTCSISHIEPIVTEPMYIADCPTASLDRIIPDWVTTSTGGRVIIKGWDFVKTGMQLVLGSTAVNATWIDTCTAVADIPAVGAATRRATSGAAKLSVQLSVNGQKSVEQVNFRVKGETASRVGFSLTKQALHKASNSAPAHSVACTGVDQTAEAMDCYHADLIVPMYPIHIAVQDAAGGDLFNGSGWTNKTQDASFSISLIRVPQRESRRKLTDILKGTLSGTTVNGSLSLDGVYLVKPRNGDYELQISSAGHTSSTFIVRIVQGSPVKLVVAKDLVDLPLISHIGNAHITRLDGEDLGLAAEIRDIAENPIGISSVADTTFLRMSIEVIPVEVIQPSPSANLTILNTSEADKFGGIRAGVPAQLVPASAELGAEAFNFGASKIQGLWFGVRYLMKFTLDSPPASLSHINSTIVSIIHSNCLNREQYGINFTSTCADVPAGGQVYPWNHSMWLFTQANYWRYNWQDRKFYECPGSNCLGGYYSTCKEGTKLHLCTVCEQKWGKQGDACLRCPSDAVNVLVLVAFSTAMLLIIIIMVDSNLSTEVKPKSIFSIIFKILMNHLQTTTLMADFMAKVQGLVKGLMNAEEKAAPDTNISSFSCVTGWNMYKIFLMWMLMPIFILSLPGLVAWIVSLCHRWKTERLKKKILKEITRREVMGLDTSDQRVHLQCLESQHYPDVAMFAEVTEEDSQADSEVSPPVSEMENTEFETALADEKTRNEDLKIAKIDKIKKYIADKASEQAEARYSECMQIVSDPHATDDSKEEAALFIRKFEDEHEAPISHQWDQHESKTTGLPYWRNRVTGESTWIKPVEHHAEVKSDEHEAKSDEHLVRPNEQGEERKPSMRRKSTIHHIIADGLSNCAICQSDFALYECHDCREGRNTPFCESCWGVIHAETGEKAHHVRYRAIVKQEEIPDHDPKYSDIFHTVAQKKREIPALEIWIVTVLVVIFLIYPRLMTQIATMMKCKTIESFDGRSFLVADMTIECETPEYNRWKFIAQMFFFLYGVGIPIGGTILLFVKRHTLLSKKTMATYGFLYSGFRMTRYYWEFVIMIRKMLVVFIIVFYAGEQIYRIMFGMWLICFFFILNIFAQPFQLKLYWGLENLSLASVTITLNAAMLYQDQFNMSAAADLGVTIFIFVVNLVVLVVFLYYLWFAAKAQFMETFDTDGSGDVTWTEIWSVIKTQMFEKYGSAKMHDWGFRMDEEEEEEDAVSDPVEAIEQPPNSPQAGDKI